MRWNFGSGGARYSDTAGNAAGSVSLWNGSETQEHYKPAIFRIFRLLAEALA
jgi:hypothetical protein